MNNPQFALLPNVSTEELLWLEQLTASFDEPTKQKFLAVYSGRRQDPQTILIVTLLGFFCVAGIQRFMTKNIGLGILYLLTGGLCLVGTIVDAINYRKIAWDFNKKEAIESASLLGLR
ncbi:MAG TPA: TM2 domain-containing protein [Chitinophaga sp.]